MKSRSKSAVSYHGISLPSPLINEVKNHIQNKPEFRSVAEFTREALREKMNKDFTIENIKGRKEIKNLMKKGGVAFVSMDELENRNEQSNIDKETLEQITAVVISTLSKMKGLKIS